MAPKISARWIVVVSSVLSYAIGIAVSLPSLDPRLPYLVALGLVGAIIVGIGVAIQEGQKQERLRREVSEWKDKYLSQSREFARPLIRRYLDMVRLQLPLPEQTRVCVFLLYPSGQELVFLDGAGTFVETERKLRFQKWQGLVGDVWAMIAHYSLNWPV